MPNYKVVLFTDSIHQSYMTSQKEAIKKALPDVTIELVDHTDSRLALFTTSQRVPCIMILKDDARMDAKHAKLSHADATNWVTSYVS